MDAGFEGGVKSPPRVQKSRRRTRMQAAAHACICMHAPGCLPKLPFSHPSSAYSPRLAGAAQPPCAAPTCSSSRVASCSPNSSVMR